MAIYLMQMATLRFDLALHTRVSTTEAIFHLLLVLLLTVTSTLFQQILRQQTMDEHSFTMAVFGMRSRRVRQHWMLGM
ncbi:MAG: inverse autotransporter beta domain-containing protein [Cytophagaceae bacterium]|nr:inverse autotransporter beta domain-containing protein [Cytophagaceae bacterium]MBP6094041.1 inverse autotransporter beta domain-containing protein [Cytophagaceae bacterium]